jgi:hypothetical protein
MENNKSRIPYVVIVILCTILALCLRFWGGQGLVHIYYWDVPVTVCSTTCLGYQAVYRISFALTIFFAILILSLCCTNVFHSSMWIGKFFLLPALLVGSFFMENSSMQVFAEFCRYASFLFLILQIISLIDFAYVVRNRVRSHCCVLR